MPTLTAADPLVEALMDVEGKAEIINGQIVNLPMTGKAPNYAAFEIAVSLRIYSQQTGDGIAVSDGAGFLCDLPGRRSFSPDAAFYSGPDPDDEMKFYPQAPTFAVEVRSENDYGPQAERAMRSKRADYFAAGTLVVWDVDLQHEQIIAKYSAADPDNAQFFGRGQVADAEAAVPGWTFSVDALFMPIMPTRAD